MNDQASAKDARPICVQEGYQLQSEHDTWARRPARAWPCPACAAILNSRKLDDWATFGIVEVAVRNRNVKEYVEHWEGRALKAEAALAQRAEAVAWIPVNERLPDSDGDYIVCVKPFLQGDSWVEVANFVTPNDTFIDGWGVRRVTHWMPFPSSPMNPVR